MSVAVISVATEAPTPAMARARARAIAESFQIRKLETDTLHVSVSPCQYVHCVHSVTNYVPAADNQFGSIIPLEDMTTRTPKLKLPNEFASPRREWRLHTVENL